MIAIVISDTICVSPEVRDMLSEGGFIHYAEGATYCALRSGAAEMHYTHAHPTSIESVLAMIEHHQVSATFAHRQLETA